MREVQIVPGAALFDLCDVELEETVQPVKEFLSVTKRARQHINVIERSREV